MREGGRKMVKFVFVFVNLFVVDDIICAKCPITSALDLGFRETATTTADMLPVINITRTSEMVTRFHDSLHYSARRPRKCSSTPAPPTPSSTTSQPDSQ